MGGNSSSNIFFKVGISHCLWNCTPSMRNKSQCEPASGRTPVDVSTTVKSPGQRELLQSDVHVVL